MLPSVKVAPYAASIKKPTAAASQSNRSLALCFVEETFENIPCPFINICSTSGTNPPVYLKVYYFLIQSCTILLYF